MFNTYRTVSLGWILSFGALFLLMSTACGNDEGFADQISGRINVTPLSVAFSHVPLGQSSDEAVIVSNTSDEPLSVSEIDFEARSGHTIADLQLVDVPSLPHTLKGGEDFVFFVRFTPTSERVNRGQIRFLSSDPNYSRDNRLTVNVDTLANRPQLQAEPNPVRFARLPSGGRADQILTIRNVGTAPLTIHEPPLYSGGSDFRISVPDRTYPLVLGVYDLEAADNDPESYILPIEVDYAPAGDGADSGEIRLVTNDIREPHPTQADRGISTITVQANADAPCIQVDGQTRTFGQVPVGSVGVDLVTVTNCGSQQLEVDSITVTENSEHFELVLPNDWDSNRDGSIDERVLLASGQSETFQIRFLPINAGTERGKVVIVSNDPVQPALTLDLVARGSEGQCPEAVATATVRGLSTGPRTSLTAIPLQYIILDGSASTDPDGQVVEYHWTLTGPAGVHPELGPTTNDPNNLDQSKREFRLLTAGEYKVGLTVTDNEGFRSCNEAEVTIIAIPNQQVHIELTWTNPEDPDETNNVGSDLDLHFMKMGPGRWFQAPYDVYYLNSNNNKDNIWNPEDPSLDIDVRNGAGPENITMDTPAACHWYAIGVHYFSEMFGTAYATVRVYINAALVYERLNMPMTNGGQFWDVARLHWNPAGIATVMEVDVVYPASLADQPAEVTHEMRASGLCTAEGLY